MTLMVCVLGYRKIRASCPLSWVISGYRLSGLHGGRYAEAISRRQDGSYHQPFHLRDRVRQPLYQLGFNLLSNLDASPAVYLLQFDLIESLTKSSSDHVEIRFDRLLPSPEEPAKASIGVQEPNLFDCHWLCITRSPIYDLVIRG